MLLKDKNRVQHSINAILSSMGSRFPQSLLLKLKRIYLSRRYS